MGISGADTGGARGAVVIYIYNLIFHNSNKLENTR